MATLRICSIPDCGKPRYKRQNWCRPHYRRWHTYGHPLGGRKTMNGEPERYLRDVVLAYSADACLVWPYARSSSGYGMLGGRLVSRLVCEEEHGPPPTPGHEAAHSCGKGHEACCTKGHLSWKTHAENMDDRDRHGTTPSGERIGTSKLKEAEVIEIRALKGMMMQKEIAALYGVDQSLIHYIHAGKIWAWLP